MPENKKQIDFRLAFLQFYVYRLLDNLQTIIRDKEGQRAECMSSPPLPLPYSFEAGSLTEPKLGCWPTSSRDLLVSVSQFCSHRHTRSCLVITWRLRIWTEVFTSVKQSFLLTEPSPTPGCYFIILLLLHDPFQLNFKVIPCAFMRKQKHARLSPTCSPWAIRNRHAAQHNILNLLKTF